jgi:(E)-4-hydroxy-3-methylbut-2-enyl-diphosphate synthase
MSVKEYLTGKHRHPQLNFVRIDIDDYTDELLEALKKDKHVVIVLDTINVHAMAEERRAIFEMIKLEITAPVVIMRRFTAMDEEKVQIFAATDCGGLLIDGLGDGILLSTELISRKKKDFYLKLIKNFNNTSFGILQAARTRMSKTEYISCPSCGRTLFDLQETTAMIRKRTDHLKGVKIGIMGCIVNGPGEMADADYGYVGVGKGKIALYRGQNVIKKSVPEGKAVDELIELIKEDGNWIEQSAVEA